MCQRMIAVESIFNIDNEMDIFSLECVILKAFLSSSNMYKGGCGKGYFF